MPPKTTENPPLGNLHSPHVRASHEDLTPDFDERSITPARRSYRVLVAIMLLLPVAVAAGAIVLAVVE